MRIDALIFRQIGRVFHFCQKCGELANLTIFFEWSSQQNPESQASEQVVFFTLEFQSQTGSIYPIKTAHNIIARRLKSTAILKTSSQKLDICPNEK